MHSIQLHGHPITYVEAGDPASPTVVLLSGWCQDHRLFKNLIPVLTPHFHVLSPDWRGHDFAQTVSGDFGTEALVDDVLAFLDAKGVADFRIASHSHGCWANIEICDRLGPDRLPRTVVIDWLMAPHDGFLRQLSEGQHPIDYAAGRQSFFDEWAATTDHPDVLNHLRAEMPSFSGEMWIRSCREIERTYRRWGSAFDRMRAMQSPPHILHLFSQPPAESYRHLQDEFAEANPWFVPHYIVGQTHFPTLESAPQVGAAIHAFLSAK